VTPLLATSLIRREKEDYYAILLSSQNFPGKALWAKPFSGYKSASNSGKTSLQEVNKQV
jgi:hypothetical protein